MGLVANQIFVDIVVKLMEKAKQKKKEKDADAHKEKGEPGK